MSNRRREERRGEKKFSKEFDQGFNFILKSQGEV
jgi:hypothetical protein